MFISCFRTWMYNPCLSVHFLILPKNAFCSFTFKSFLLSFCCVYCLLFNDLSIREQASVSAWMIKLCQIGNCKVR